MRKDTMDGTNHICDTLLEPSQYDGPNEESQHMIL